MKVMQDFKAFIMRGNVVSLAVAVAVGAAFTAVVTAFVTDIITPLIGMVVGKQFGGLTFTIHHSTIFYGLVIQALVTFVSVAAVIFFVVVQPMNILEARRARGQGDPDPTTRQCPECLSDIPLAAKRCAFCTAQVPPAAAAATDAASAG